MSDHAPCDTDRVVYPLIRCPRDSGVLPIKAGRYGACPLCGYQPDEKFISKQRYLLGETHDAVLFAWDPLPDELVYVHRHSTYIPENSVLVVNPNQVAAYTSGGKRAVCKSETYALSSESPNPDIAAIARAIRDGTQQKTTQQLNTSIVFFDTRKHELDITIEKTLPSGRWFVRLPLRVSYCIGQSGIEALLLHALDLNDNASFSGELKQTIRACIEGEFSAALSELSTESIEEANSCEDIRKLLKSRLFPVIRDRSNVLLARDWDLAVDIQPKEPEILDGVVIIPCPFPSKTLVGGRPQFDLKKSCGGLHTIPKGSHKPSVCPKCRETLRWCNICHRFTSDFRQDYICDGCSTKYTTL